MNKLLEAHLKHHLRARHWLTMLACLLNGLYWRVPIGTSWYGLIASTIVLLSISALVLSLDSARKPQGGRRRTGRRLDALLIAASVLVLVSLAIDLSGLRRVWGLP